LYYGQRLKTALTRVAEVGRDFFSTIRLCCTLNIQFSTKRPIQVKHTLWEYNNVFDVSTSPRSRVAAISVRPAVSDSNWIFRRSTFGTRAFSVAGPTVLELAARFVARSGRLHVSGGIWKRISLPDIRNMESRYTNQHLMPYLLTSDVVTYQ